MPVRTTCSRQILQHRNIPRLYPGFFINAAYLPLELLKISLHLIRIRLLAICARQIPVTRAKVIHKKAG